MTNTKSAKQKKQAKTTPSASTPARTVIVRPVVPKSYPVHSTEVITLPALTASASTGGLAVVLAVSRKVLTPIAGVYNLDPTTWLGKIGGSFDRVKIVSLRVKVPSMYPTTQGGQIAVWFRSDAEAPTAPPSGVTHAGGRGIMAMGPMWSDLSLVVPKSALGKSLVDVVDNATTFAGLSGDNVMGNIYLGWVSNPALATGSPPPALMIEYDAVLDSPTR